MPLITSWRLKTKHVSQAIAQAKRSRNGPGMSSSSYRDKLNPARPKPNDRYALLYDVCNAWTFQMICNAHAQHENIKHATRTKDMTCITIKLARTNNNQQSSRAWNNTQKQSDAWNNNQNTYMHEIIIKNNNIPEIIIKNNNMHEIIIKIITCMQ